MKKKEKDEPQKKLRPEKSKKSKKPEKLQKSENQQAPTEAREKSTVRLEMEKLKRDLDEANQMRGSLVELIGDQPNEENSALLAKLEDAIEIGRRRLSSMSAAEFRRHCEAFAEELTQMIAETDDEEFLRLDEDSEPVRHLRACVGIRDTSVATLKFLHPDDNPDELINLFDNVIADARRQIKEKREQAERRFPQMRKVYEMDEGYKKTLADLVESIDTRDALAETLKLAVPKERAEGLRLLAMLDKKIDEGEQALAVEYEAFQTHERAKDDLRRLLKSYSPEELRGIREHLKENPADMELVREMLGEEFPE